MTQFLLQHYFAYQYCTLILFNNIIYYFLYQYTKLCRCKSIKYSVDHARYLYSTFNFLEKSLNVKKNYLKQIISLNIKLSIQYFTSTQTKNKKDNFFSVRESQKVVPSKTAERKSCFSHELTPRKFKFLLVNKKRFDNLIAEHDYKSLRLVIVRSFFMTFQKNEIRNGPLFSSCCTYVVQAHREKAKI